MATLATDTPREFETGHDDFINEFGVVASDIIYDGAAVGFLNETATVQPLATGSTIDKFAGFCVEKADNSAGAASAINAKLKEHHFPILSVVGASAITDQGKDVYATDDNTFTLTIGGVWIGTIARWISGTKCVVEAIPFRKRPSFFVSSVGQTTEAATDRTFFVAPYPCYVKSLTCSFGVAAGGASKLQVTKDTATDAPGAGTDLLTDNTNTGFDLNATANTVQYGTITSTSASRKLAKGDRLAIDFANIIQSTAGLVVTAELVRL